MLRAVENLSGSDDKHSRGSREDESETTVGDLFDVNPLCFPFVFIISRSETT